MDLGIDGLTATVELWRGWIADVHAGEHQRFGPVVVKRSLWYGGDYPIDPPTARDLEPFLRRCEALRALRGSGGLEVLLDFWAAPGDRIAYVVVPAAPRSLARRLREEGPLGWPEAAAIGSAMAAGLARLQAAGLVHGGVRAGTVRTPPDAGPYLCDLVALPDPGTTRPVCNLRAAIQRAAPELRDASSSGPTAAADAYALACTIFEVVGGRYRHAEDARLDVVLGDLRPPDATGLPVPPALRNLLTAMWQHDPGARPGAAAVRDALRDL